MGMVINHFLNGMILQVAGKNSGIAEVWGLSSAYHDVRGNPCLNSTHPKFNIALKSYIAPRKVLFQPSIFRGYVNFRGCGSREFMGLHRFG